MNDLTGIMSAIDNGDPTAAEQLLPLIYDELRKLAAAKLAREKPGQTLQATALVHEAYVRLMDREATPTWKSRGHFFAAAAEAMRRILVDQARRQKAVKRGGDRVRQEWDSSDLAAPRPAAELLAVSEILDRLEEVDPVAANLVKLRFFAGLSMAETAAALGISVRSATDVWTYARTWLHQRLNAE